MEDVVHENGVMTLTRRPVAWLWAAVTSTSRPSYQARSGYSVMENRDFWYTHRIVVRSESRVEVSAAAWVYEERMISSPRWYKVLGWQESDCSCWLTLECRLMERSPDVQPPAPTVLSPMTSKVEL